MFHVDLLCNLFQRIRPFSHKYESHSKATLLGDNVKTTWGDWIDKTPNWKSATVSLTQDGGTPIDCSLLEFAVALRSVPAVQLFLERGANPNAKHSPPIFYYFLAIGRSSADVQQCTTDIVELLLRYGGDINATNSKGETALHLACYHGCEDFIRLALQQKADFAPRTKLGLTPLHYAAVGKVDNPNIVSLLLNGSHDVNIYTRTNFGETPLALASWKQNWQTAFRLLEHGAMVVVDDESCGSTKDAMLNLSPFGYVVENGNVDLTFRLLRQIVATRARPFAWMVALAEKELPTKNPFHNLRLQIRYYAPWKQYKK